MEKVVHTEPKSEANTFLFGSAFSFLVKEKKKVT